METLAPKPSTSSASSSLASMSVMAPSFSPSLIVPSAKAMEMSSEELCKWLKQKTIDDDYIERFRKEEVDGSELATYTDDDLKELGISESRIRKKIMVQFRKIN